VDKKLLSTLQAADDAEQWEFPTGFDWHKSICKVRELRPIIESIAGRALTLDDQAQDATYFASLAISEPILGEPNHRREVFAIYFSCFGSLAGVWNEGVFSQASMDRIKEELERHGLDVVDAAQLREPYTGLHKGFAGRTWLDRFFNYSRGTPRPSPNQLLHADRGRILFFRGTTPLRRPRWVNWIVRQIGTHRGGKTFPVGV
jgi:hypothetical protein